MRELIQEMAGEHKKGSSIKHEKESGNITYIKKLSGLEEEYPEENKIYIHKPKDIEKFYYVLIKTFENNGEAINIIKNVFNKVIY